MSESSASLPPSEMSPLPASRRRTLFLVIFTLIVSTTLTGWVHQEEEQLVPGYVTAPTVIVRAPQDGLLREWLVPDGAIVGPRQELLRFTDAGLNRQLAEVRDEIQRLETELRRREAKADVELAWRLRTIEAEILANRLKAAELIQREYDQRIELHAWQQRLRGKEEPLQAASPDTVFRTAARQDEFFRRQWSKVIQQHESARNAVEVSQVQIQLCENRLKELQQLKKELPEKVRRAAGVDETAGRLAAARKHLKQLQDRQEIVTLFPPAYGKVRIEVRNTHRLVKAHTPLARIVDEERRYLSVAVPPEYLGRFKVGQTVTIRFDGHRPRRGLIRDIRIPDVPQTDTVTMIIQPSGRIWPIVPLGSAAYVVVPRDE